jgi:hypothetical protein
VSAHGDGEEIAGQIAGVGIKRQALYAGDGLITGRRQGPFDRAKADRAAVAL